MKLALGMEGNVSLCSLFFFFFFEEIKMEFINNGSGPSLAQGVLKRPPKKSRVIHNNYRYKGQHQNKWDLTLFLKMCGKGKVETLCIRNRGWA